jgi:hypothetical protein
MAQVCPPSFETMIEAPTATQNVDVGQATPPRAPVPGGKVAAVHVFPPSFDVIAWPTKACPLEGEVTPIAVQFVMVEQVTPSNVALAMGRTGWFQVAPPFAEARITPLPTATH